MGVDFALRFLYPTYPIFPPFSLSAGSANATRENPAVGLNVESLSWPKCAYNKGRGFGTVGKTQLRSVYVSSLDVECDVRILLKGLNPRSRDVWRIEIQFL